MRNLEAVQQGLRIVRDALAPLIERVLTAEYGSDWWKKGVLEALVRDGKPVSDRPKEGNSGDLDLQLALKLIQVYHWNLFSDDLNWSGRERTLLAAIIGARNEYEGHVTPNREVELTDTKTKDILEGMEVFLDRFDRKSANEISNIADCWRLKTAIDEKEEIDEYLIPQRKENVQKSDPERISFDPRPVKAEPVKKTKPSIVWGEAIRSEPIHTVSEKTEYVSMCKPEPEQITDTQKASEVISATEEKPKSKTSSVLVEEQTENDPLQIRHTSALPRRRAAERKLAGRENTSESYKVRKAPEPLPDITPRRAQKAPYEVEIRSEAGKRGTRILTVETEKKVSAEKRRQRKNSVPPGRLAKAILLAILGTAIGAALILLDRWLPAILG